MTAGIVATLVIVVPGVGATMALYRPGELGVVTRAALSVGLGCAVSGGVAFLLAVGRVLGPASFFAFLGVVTAGLWFLGLRRAGMREHGRAVAADWRADPWPLAAGLVVLVGFAAIRLTFSPNLHFEASSSWRYWADAVEIGDAGRIPSQVLQYGAVYPSVINKVYLNALNAGIGFAIGFEPLRAMAALQWIGSVGVALSLWSLGRELGLRFTAALLPVLLVSNWFILNTELTADLVTFKAETFSRLVAFVGAALGVRALRSRRGWKDPVTAGALLGVAAGIHIVPVIIAVVVVAAYAVGRLLADRDLQGTLRASLTAAGVTLAVGGAILVLPRGDLGLRGATGPAGYDAFAEGFDPTLYLNAGAVPGRREVGPDTFYISPGTVVQQYVHSAIGLPPSRWLRSIWVPGVALGGLVVAAAILLWFPPEMKPIGLTAWGLGAAIVVLTWLFALRYDLYIPSRFGIRRLFDYSSIPVALALLALAEGALLALGRIRSWVTIAAGVLVIFLVGAPLLVDARAGSPRPRAVALEQGFHWIRANTSCDARLLPNAHTEGVFQALTGRPAVLEGATPYLRPSILEPIVRLHLEARDFFHDPAGHQAFLASQGVDYVVLLTGGRVGYREAIGATNRPELARLPVLQLAFRNGGMTIYHVTSGGGGGRFPDPAEYPGYDCRRGPIAATGPGAE